MPPIPHPPPRGDRDEVVVVRVDEEVLTRQELPAFFGISTGTAGARGICMNLVRIPPGGAAAPHLHLGFESAIYVVAGCVETRYGRGLRRSLIARAGDFLYIPPDVPHQPVNLSGTEPALAVVARNTGEEQESVRAYDPDDDPEG